MKKDKKLVEVCDKCFQASCWYGEVMCDFAREAGTVLKTVRELKKLGYEDEHYWSDEKMLDVCGSKAPNGYETELPPLNNRDMQKPHPTDTAGNFLWDLHCWYCVNGKVHPIEEYGKEREKAEHIINLILPLAKGYVAKNDVGSNRAYIQAAENYLTTHKQ